MGIEGMEPAAAQMNLRTPSLFDIAAISRTHFTLPPEVVSKHSSSSRMFG
jgi:hypothetical protein